MKRTRLLGAVLALFAVTNVAYAVTYNEVGDTGELLATAQDTTGLGLDPLTSISGSLIDLGGGIDDVDLYRINIFDTNAFSVTVSANLSVDNDAMMFLFDSAGAFR